MHGDLAESGDLPTADDLLNALAYEADVKASIRIAVLAEGLANGTLAIVSVPGPRRARPGGAR